MIDSHTIDLRNPIADHPLNDGRRAWFVVWDIWMANLLVVDILDRVRLVRTLPNPALQGCENQICYVRFGTGGGLYSSTGQKNIYDSFPMSPAKPYTFVLVCRIDPGFWSGGAVFSFTKQKSSGNYEGFNPFYLNVDKTWSHYIGNISGAGLLGTRISAPQIESDFFHMLVLTYAGNNSGSAGIKMYIDGFQFPHTTVSNTWNSAINIAGIPWNINGRDNNGSTASSARFYFSEAQIYERELSSQEVYDLYFEWLAGYPNLIRRLSYPSPLQLPLVPVSFDYDLPIEYAGVLSANYDLPIEYYRAQIDVRSVYNMWVLDSRPTNWTLKRRS